MRNLPKTVVAFTAVMALGVLVACGGGGSGTSTPSAPSNPGAPTSPPSNGATSTPTPVGATPSPTPSSTPTPHGATPSPSPTATATPTPTPTPTPTATAHAGTGQINVGYGETNGSTNALLISTAANTRGYTGGGNLMPSQTGATTTGGGQGSPVDGIACQGTMSGNYHVHFYLGVFYNGQQVVVPAGLGMLNPEPPTDTINGVPNQSWIANCYYDVHIHDNSGMVHVESTNTQNGQNCGPIANEQPECNYSIFTFQQFLDEWGISVSPTNFGPLTGPVQIYTQTGQNLPAQYCTDPCTVSSSTTSFYTPGTSGLGAIPIYSHTMIWIVIGTPPTAGLPNVYFEEGDP